MAMAEKQDLDAPKIEFPGTKPLGGKAEISQVLIGLAQENQQKLQEIQENAVPPIISEKVKNKIVKTTKAVLGGGMALGAVIPLFGCKATSVVEEKATAPSETRGTTSSTTAVETAPTITETTPETTTPETIRKVDTPEIKGQTFNLTFNQENKTYLNEKEEVVGFLIEDAVNIEGKLGPAIVLNAETLNKILAENKEKGIFKCIWPIDFQKNKGIEVVELLNNPLNEQKVFEHLGVYPPSGIGIKYSEPIGFYAPFDVGESWGHLFEGIPDKEGPDFYSAQPSKNLSLGNESLGGLQYNFIEWETGVELSKAEIVGNNDAYDQGILEEIKCGDFLGKILPNTSDFNFLDFANNEEFYENPGQFQGRLLITAFNDDLSKKTSSLEKMLKYLNKAGQEIPVGVWSEENTAHEQTN